MSLRGLHIARQINKAYTPNSNVAAVILSGSVARGYADEYSDLEIGVFWKQPPNDDERRSAIAHAGGDLWSFHSYEHKPEQVVNEHYGLSRIVIDGVVHTGNLMIDVKHFTMAGAERCLCDVLDQFDTTPAKHILLAAIQDAIPLFGNSVIESWQHRLKAYPHKLAIKVIQENLWCGPWFIPQAYVQRDDYLVLYQHFIWMQQSILKVLAGLNRMFYPSAEYKWASEFINQFILVPANLAQRMKHVFKVAPSAGMQEMLVIVQETVNLVGQHLPEVNQIAMFDGHPEINTEWARRRWDAQAPYTLMQAILIEQDHEHPT